MTLRRTPVIPHPRAPKGHCRWCGEPILRPNGEILSRRQWHRGDPAERGTRNCVAEYKGGYPAEQRRRVWERDHGICNICGRECAPLGRIGIEDHDRAAFGQTPPPPGVLHCWHVDHIVPLEDGGRHDESNLQTACVPCHRTKTAQENSARRRRGRRPR